MNNELISVIMPVYNRERYLDEAISSIVAQTYTNWELVLIDDASTDKSWDIASKWESREPRIRLFRHETNQGICISRNRGVAESNGELIAFLDSDDMAEPMRFETQIELLVSGYDMVGSSVLFVDSKNQELGLELVASSENEIQHKMRYTLPLPNPTLMAKRDVFTKVGEYRFPCAEDYDFFLRACELGFTSANVLAPLVRMRMHMENTGVLHVRKQRFLTDLAWRLHEERLEHGHEVSDWKAELSKPLGSESYVEQRAAHFYRKAYVLQNTQKFWCAMNLLFACALWPPNLIRLLRRLQ